jgi:hypothetical protein
MSNGLPPAYQPCTVDGAGAYAGDSGRDGPPDVNYDPGGLYVILTDVGGAFKKQFFYFDRAGNAWPREMLSVALTAISTKREVGAIVDPPPYDGLDQAPNCRALAILPARYFQATWEGNLYTWNTLCSPPQNGPFGMPVYFTREVGQWKMNVSTFSADIGERFDLQPYRVGTGTVNGGHATLQLPLQESGSIPLALTVDLSTDATISPAPDCPQPDGSRVPDQSGMPHSGNQLTMVGQGTGSLGGTADVTLWAMFQGTIDAWP